MKLNISPKTESIIFAGLVILNCWPLFLFRYFPSVDGPSHIYNSTIANTLLFGEPGLIHAFFTFRHEPIPNIVSTALMSFLNYFLPAFLAEKSLVLIYFLSLPISFRWLTKIISPKSTFLSFLIFPFVYNIFISTGFHGFSLSLVSLFITLAYWLKHIYPNPAKPKPKKLIVFALLAALTYFSHLFSFLALGVVIIFHLLLKTERKVSCLKNYPFRQTILNALPTALAVIPEIILGLLFIIERPTPIKAISSIYLPLPELIKNLFTLNLLPNLNTKEAILSYLIIALLITLITTVIHRSIRHQTKKIPLLYTSFFFLILYFNFPTIFASGAYISERLLFSFYIFLILWLSAQTFPSYYKLITIITITTISFGFIWVRYPFVRDINPYIQSFYDTEKYITPNSTILPIIPPETSFYYHFSGYLGIEKPVVILDNFEADSPHFPIKYNPHIPPTTFGELYNIPDCLYLKNNDPLNENPIPIDYIVVWSDNLSHLKPDCQDKINYNLNKYYTKIYSSDNNFTHLYELKKQ